MELSKAGVVDAVNKGNNLAKLVITFLRLWNKHCNGINNVWVPKEFTVQFIKLKNEHVLNIGYLTLESYTYLQEYSQSRNDDDEHWGYGGSPADYLELTDYKWVAKSCNVPISYILDSNLENTLKELAEKEKLKKEQEAKQKKIASLKEELEKLEKS